MDDDMVLTTVALKLKMNKKKAVGLHEIQGAGDLGSFYGHLEARRFKSFSSRCAVSTWRAAQVP